jgi:multicomponent Na+:H+ antiporter subunit G
VSVRVISADVLLGLAAAVVLASCLGLVVMRDVYTRLHYLTPISLVAPALVAVAVGVRMGLRENTAETWLTLLVLAIAGPYLTHATIRAARVREKGDWRPGGDGRPGERRRPDQASSTVVSGPGPASGRTSGPGEGAR